MSDTTEPGYLRPTSDPGPYDDELLDLLQPFLAGVTGLPGRMVRPTRQPDDTPNLPGYGEDWLAFGISRARTDTFSHEAHDPAGQGSDVTGRSEELDLLVSCYGEHARGTAMVLHDGAQLGQNRAPLNDLGIDLLSVGDAISLPALLHGKWTKRVDVTLTLRRYVSRRYGVRTIVAPPRADATAVQFGLDNGLYVTPILADAP